MRIKTFAALFFALIISCKEKTVDTPGKEAKVKPKRFLPFQPVDLTDLSAFKTVSENWKVARSAYVDRSKERTLSFEEGSGVLVNLPTDEAKENLFTSFEHGDIEVAVDVMMPKGSNSGLYFQGRYEVQLLDSWDVDNPQHSDLGGIYHRWDDDRGKGKEGYEGSAPKMNAAKSPGLWQHFRIIFHAPKFDASGEKTENARFEKVWLNGVLVQENVEVSGPTRAAAFEDEKPLGPLMIQGDHGPVAIKNFGYKTYEDRKVKLTDMAMIEYENGTVAFPDLDSLAPMRKIKTDSISANMASGKRASRILKYDGSMNIPDPGDYLFELKLNEGGGLLLVDNDTVVNLDGDYNLDSLGLGKVSLQKGNVPFTLIYNKHRAWRRGFSLEVEGPGIQKYTLTAPNSLDLSGVRPEENIMVQALDEPVAQRSFLMHNGKKRTHCVSVGTPSGTHFAYDLTLGSLLKVWHGDFLDATEMWHSRGERQLGVPAGFTVSFHGDTEFAVLGNEGSVWPENLPEDSEQRSLGYEFGEDRIPVFSYRLGSSTVSDKMIPSKTLRMLHRTITANGEQGIWHKVAAGEAIEKLPDGTFIVNDESYFIDFSDSNELNPVVRESNGVEELLVKIPAGEQKIDYNIIW